MPHGIDRRETEGRRAVKVGKFLTNNLVDKNRIAVVIWNNKKFIGLLRMVNYLVL